MINLISGECPLKCNSLITFVLFLTMALFLTGVTQNPLLMVTMRSVQKHERAFALGFQFVILRLLAYIPSPIIYGTVIDAACVHWKRNCGDRGDCLVTDLKLLNKYLIGLSFAVKVGAAAFYIMLFIILPKHLHTKQPDSEDPVSIENHTKISNENHSKLPISWCIYVMMEADQYWLYFFNVWNIYLLRIIRKVLNFCSLFLHIKYISTHGVTIDYRQPVLDGDHRLFRLCFRFYVRLAPW